MQLEKNNTKLGYVYILFISFYLSISGIYWLPGISNVFILNAKNILILTLFLISLFLPIKTRKLINIISLLGLFGLLTLFIILYHENIATAYQSSLHYFRPMIWLIILSKIPISLFNYFLKYIYFSTFFFIIITFFPVFVSLKIIPNFYPPEEYFQISMPLGFDSLGNEAYWLEKSSVIGAGFAGISTSWAVLIPPFTLFFLSLVKLKIKSVIIRIFISFIVLLFTIYSIVLTNARGGSFVLLFLGCIHMFTLIEKKNPIFLLGLTCTIFILIIFSYPYIPDDFFRGYNSNVNIGNQVDDISNGRLTTWIYGIETFSSSPFFGVGYRNAFMGNLQIHNTFLRVLAETGFFCFIIFIFIVYLIIKNVNIDYGLINEKKRIYLKSSYPDISLPIYSVLIMALLEPNVIFGSFNSSSIFWTCVFTSYFIKTHYVYAYRNCLNKK